jgi:hypothetical protein
MDFNASTGSQAGSRIPFPQTMVDSAPPPTRAALLLAESIHESSLRLMAINDRLAAALKRLAGPRPVEEASAKSAAPTPEGALPLAQFGVTLIHKEIDRTRRLVEWLEEIA